MSTRKRVGAFSPLTSSLLTNYESSETSCSDSTERTRPSLFSSNSDESQYNGELSRRTSSNTVRRNDHERGTREEAFNRGKNSEDELDDDESDGIEMVGYSRLNDDGFHQIADDDAALKKENVLTLSEKRTKSNQGMNDLVQPWESDVHRNAGESWTNELQQRKKHQNQFSEKENSAGLRHRSSAMDDILYTDIDEHMKDFERGLVENDASLQRKAGLDLLHATAGKTNPDSLKSKAFYIYGDGRPNGTFTSKTSELKLLKSPTSSDLSENDGDKSASLTSGEELGISSNLGSFEEAYASNVSQPNKVYLRRSAWPAQRKSEDASVHDNEQVESTLLNDLDKKLLLPFDDEESDQERELPYKSLLEDRYSKKNLQDSSGALDKLPADEFYQLVDEFGNKLLLGGETFKENPVFVTPDVDTDLEVNEAELTHDGLYLNGTDLKFNTRNNETTIVNRLSKESAHSSLEALHDADVTRIDASEGSRPVTIIAPAHLRLQESFSSPPQYTPPPVPKSAPPDSSQLRNLTSLDEPSEGAVDIGHSTNKARLTQSSEFVKDDRNENLAIMNPLQSKQAVLNDEVHSMPNITSHILPSVTNQLSSDIKSSAEELIQKLPVPKIRIKPSLHNVELRNIHTSTVAEFSRSVIDDPPIPPMPVRPAPRSDSLQKSLVVNGLVFPASSIQQDTAATPIHLEPGAIATPITKPMNVADMKSLQNVSTLNTPTSPLVDLPTIISIESRTRLFPDLKATHMTRSISVPHNLANQLDSDPLPEKYSLDKSISQSNDSLITRSVSESHSKLQLLEKLSSGIKPNQKELVSSISLLEKNKSHSDQYVSKSNRKTSAVIVPSVSSPSHTLKALPNAFFPAVYLLPSSTSSQASTSALKVDEEQIAIVPPVPLSSPPHFVSADSVASENVTNDFEADYNVISRNEKEVSLRNELRMVEKNDDSDVAKNYDSPQIGRKVLSEMHSFKTLLKHEMPKYQQMPRETEVFQDASKLKNNLKSSGANASGSFEFTTQINVSSKVEQFPLLDNKLLVSLPSSVDLPDLQSPPPVPKSLPPSLVVNNAMKNSRTADQTIFEADKTSEKNQESLSNKDEYSAQVLDELRLRNMDERLFTEVQFDEDSSLFGERHRSTLQTNLVKGKDLSRTQEMLNIDESWTNGKSLSLSSVKTGSGLVNSNDFIAPNSIKSDLIPKVNVGLPKLSALEPSTLTAIETQSNLIPKAPVRMVSNGSTWPLSSSSHNGRAALTFTSSVRRNVVDPPLSITTHPQALSHREVKPSFDNDGLHDELGKLLRSRLENLSKHEGMVVDDFRSDILDRNENIMDVGLRAAALKLEDVTAKKPKFLQRKNKSAMAVPEAKEKFKGSMLQKECEPSVDSGNVFEHDVSAADAFRKKIALFELQFSHIKRPSKFQESFGTEKLNIGKLKTNFREPQQAVVLKEELQDNSRSSDITSRQSKRESNSVYSVSSEISKERKTHELNENDAQTASINKKIHQSLNQEATDGSISSHHASSEKLLELERTILDLQQKLADNKTAAENESRSTNSKPMGLNDDVGKHLEIDGQKRIEVLENTTEDLQREQLLNTSRSRRQPLEAKDRHAQKSNHSESVDAESDVRPGSHDAAFQKLYKLEDTILYLQRKLHEAELISVEKTYLERRLRVVEDRLEVRLSKEREASAEKRESDPEKDVTQSRLSDNERMEMQDSKRDLQAKYVELSKLAMRVQIAIAPLKARIARLSRKCQTKNELIVKLADGLNSHERLEPALKGKVEQETKELMMLEHARPVSPMTLRYLDRLQHEVLQSIRESTSTRHDSRPDRRVTSASGLNARRSHAIELIDSNFSTDQSSLQRLLIHGENDISRKRTTSTMTQTAETVQNEMLYSSSYFDKATSPRTQQMAETSRFLTSSAANTPLSSAVALKQTGTHDLKSSVHPLSFSDGEKTSQGCQTDEKNAKVFQNTQSDSAVDLNEIPPLKGSVLESSSYLRSVELLKKTEFLSVLLNAQKSTASQNVGNIEVDKFSSKLDFMQLKSIQPASDIDGLMKSLPGLYRGGPPLSAKTTADTAYRPDPRMSQPDQLKLDSAPFDPAISPYHVGRPGAPRRLYVQRLAPSNDELSSVLITWLPPDMDASTARSNGSVVAGYKITVSGRPVQFVSGAHVTRAVIEGVKQRDRQCVMQTVSEDGLLSQPIEALLEPDLHYDVTMNELR